MRIIHELTLAAMAISAAHIVGCGGTATVSQWQSNAEQYVIQQGAGDVASIHALAPPTQQPIFSVIGGDDPEGSTDVAGLLLGRRTIAGQPWDVFLLGAGKGQQIDDLHLAAVTTDSTRFTWRVGNASDEMSAKYQRGSIPGRAAPAVLSPDPFAFWRNGAERFDLQATGSVLRVTHRASGAIWQLDTAAPTAPPRLAAQNVRSPQPAH